MKKLEPIECAAPFCTEIFVPTNPNQIYCCKSCCNRANDLRKMENRKRLRAKRKAKDPWNEIKAVMKKYKEETGRCIQYKEAVLLVEREKAKGVV